MGRVIALYARSVVQQEAATRQYDEHLRLQRESEDRQRRQFEHQRRTGKWVLIGAAVLLGVLVLSLFLSKDAQAGGLDLLTDLCPPPAGTMPAWPPASLSA